EPGEKQRAQRDALRSRQAHRASGARHGREIEMIGNRGRTLGGDHPRALFPLEGELASHALRASRAVAKALSRPSPSAAATSRSRRWTCPRYRASSSTSSSRFATAMSRHISGELEAIRVKSRKPPAANRK